MRYVVKHQFDGEPGQRYRIGDKVNDPQWANLRSLVACGYIEPEPDTVVKRDNKTPTKGKRG